MTTTLVKPELEAKVEGLGEIYRLNIPFDQALESLKEFGIKTPTSARELAYSRIKEGRMSSLSSNGSYTREGFLYLKDEPILLALNSPLLDLELARQAVEANKKGNYFLSDSKIYIEQKEIAENDKSKKPEQRSVLILPKRENYNIPITAFNEDELTLFLFKDKAEDYGMFLRENKINEIPVLLVDKNYVDSQEQSVLTQLWLRGLDGRSGLDGYDRGLDYSGRVRGVFEKAGEAGRTREKPTLKQKIKLPYNKRQVDSISNIVLNVKEGRFPALKLELVLKFLEGLK